MAESGIPITVGPQWVDIYSATGITAGTPLLVTNAGPSAAYLALDDVEPTTAIGSFISIGEQYQIDGSNAGAWAQSQGQSVTLYVQDARGGIREMPFSDPRTIDGNKAVTMQPYTELNIKRGSQFYARVGYPIGGEIAAGATVKMHFVVGDTTILVKDRFFHYIGEELQLDIYAGPTGVTGGTSVMISNWNAKSPNASLVTATRDVTTITDGALLQDPEYFFGAAATGQRVSDAIPEGYERVIPPNSEFLVTIKNNAANPARFQYGLSWYEGPISTEIP